MTGIFIISVQEKLLVSILPLLVILVPLFGSFLVGLFGFRSIFIRNLSVIVTTSLTLVLTIYLLHFTLQGFQVYYELPQLAGVSLGLRVDLMGSVFALFTAAIWLLASLASIPYMDHESNQTRYYIFLVLSLAGCLGVFLSGDFLSLFLFFEMMTLAAYALVVHTQTDESMAAGKNYLYMGVVGGLSLLSGIILLQMFTGSVVIDARLTEIIPLQEAAILIAVLMILGFGVKAGMIPLHIWLPQAHPVAPSPASALLSGIMIKTGAYGIIRVSAMLYTPGKNMAETVSWQLTENLGHSIIWIGIFTMLIAAIMAVLQNNAKRLLAYSSISQMGYILMGVGAAVYLGFDGPMGFGGFSYHIVNHAFFKSGMFILFGIIYSRLHEIRLDQLGGLWRSFPVTFIAFAVCAAGITGIPGFNGYVSKTLLHHAIVEAYEHHHLWDLWLAEKIFMLTSGLTACYIGKLFISIFLGDQTEKIKTHLAQLRFKESWLERIVAFSFIVIILGLGLYASPITKNVIVPMAGAFTYSDYYLNYLAKTNIWVIKDLLGVFIGLALGVSFYVIFRRTNIFNYQPPAYLSVERSVYLPAINILGSVFTKTGRAIDDNVNRGFHNAPVILAKTSKGLVVFDDQLLKKMANRFVCLTARGWEAVYLSWTETVAALLGRLGKTFNKVFMMLFKFDYSARGDSLFETINISNIDFDLYIILIVIGAVLATSLLFLL